MCNSPIEGNGGAENLLKEGYRAVFLAPGLWDAVSPGSQSSPYPGAVHLGGLSVGSERRRFEEMVNPRSKGKTVAVIGGGSVAMDCIESAVKLGAKDVYLVYRRSYAQMPAETDERGRNPGCRCPLPAAQPARGLCDRDNSRIKPA